MGAKKFLAVAAASFGLLVSACNGESGGGSSSSSNVAEGLPDIILGDPNAPIEVVEYASVTCGVCAGFHAQVFPEFKEKYIDTGHVRFIMREFPTPPASLSVAGSLMARCTGEENYYDVLNILFSRFPEWINENPRDSLLAIAATAGLSESEFNTCVSDEDSIRGIDAQVRYAQREYGINGTPSFIINGRFEEVRSLASFDAVLEPLIGQASE